MQGIDLSRRFYEDMVRPWLRAAYPDVRHAAALIGYGSEVLGFDDEMSRDHNWGPRVWLFVGESEFAARADAIVERFAAFAPASFEGVPIGYSKQTPQNAPGVRCDIRHGVEVRTLEATLAGGLGVSLAGPSDNRAWLGLAEQWLLEFTGGAVFHDDDGRLTAMRQRLTYLPRDVWLYKLACQWRRIAEEQAFVGRTGLSGDEVGSRVIAARLARDVMRTAFLVERRYTPYPKWFGTAFAQLPAAAELAPLVARTLAASDWRTREAALAASYLALGRLHRTRGLPGRFEPVTGPYFGRPFTVINADEITAAIRAEIEDPVLRDMPIIGSLDQVTDAAPVIVAPGRARRAMAALLDDLETAAIEEA
jgi:hypothetical protein